MPSFPGSCGAATQRKDAQIYGSAAFTIQKGVQYLPAARNGLPGRTGYHYRNIEISLSEATNEESKRLLDARVLKDKLLAYGKQEYGFGSFVSGKEPLLVCL